MSHSADAALKQGEAVQAEPTKKHGKKAAQALWTTKHAPKTVNEIAGNEEARETIKKWAFDWQRGKRGKPLMLYGPTGCGKTALVRALANEMQWTLVESNASTDRGGGDFAKLASVANANDLYGAKRLLFIDEADAVFDRVSRGKGGKALATALAPVLEERAFPIILAAENAWEQKLAPVRSYCSLVEFKRVNWRALAKTLGKIAAEETAEGNADANASANAACSQEKIELLARNAGGDLRAAINDLQATCSGSAESGSGTDAKRDPNAAAAAEPSERDRQEKVFETLRQIFHARTFADALRAADSSGEDLERLILWVQENVSREYGDAREVAAATDALSKAAVFQSRIRRSQNWSLLKYVRALAFAGVAAARRETKARFTSYAYPSVLKSMGESKKTRETLKTALLKIEGALHCSRKQALETALTFAKTPGFTVFFALTDDEKELLSSFE